MAISQDELVRQLATLGVIATAANGAFHDLPGGGGGSSGLMVQIHATQDASPNGHTTVIYPYDTPKAVPAFVRAAILDPHIASGPEDESGLDYTLTVQSFTQGIVVQIQTAWNFPGKTDPLEPVDQQLGLIIEDFVPTVVIP